MTTLSKSNSSPNNINLNNTFNVWYKYTPEQNNTNKKEINQVDYSGMLKQLFEFSTIDDFFNQYAYLKKPDQAKTGLEISIFKDKIKPMWEEEANKVGGKLTLKVRKDYANPLWDELVLRLIGQSFPEIENDEINGVMYLVKRDMIVIQIWFRNFNSKVNSLVISSVRSIFEIPENIELDVRAFNKPKNNYGGGYSNNTHK